MILYHVSGWSELEHAQVGDTVVLKPGSQHAEGKGVYFSEERPRFSAAEGAREGVVAVIVGEPETEQGWWKTKGSVVRKYGRPRSWHSAGADVAVTVKDRKMVNGIPYLYGSLRRLSEHSADTVKEKPTDVWTVLAVGDEVETPEGPGTIEAIELALSNYYDKVELEPPQVRVQLEDGSSIQTCICNLTLQSPEDTEALQAEFSRLWPAEDEHVPEDSESMLPQEASMSRPREFTINGRVYREVEAARRESRRALTSRSAGLEVFPAYRDRDGRDFDVVLDGGVLGSVVLHSKADEYQAEDHWGWGVEQERLQGYLPRSKWGSCCYASKEEAVQALLAAVQPALDQGAELYPYKRRDYAPRGASRRRRSSVEDAMEYIYDDYENKKDDLKRLGPEDAAKYHMELIKEDIRNGDDWWKNVDESDLLAAFRTMERYATSRGASRRRKVRSATKSADLVFEGEEYQIELNDANTEFRVYWRHDGILEEVADGDWNGNRAESTADLGDELWLEVEMKLIDLEFEDSDYTPRGASRRRAVPDRFYVSAFCMADEAGMPRDEAGLDEDFDVLIYRDEDGWHVGGEGAQGMTDEEWAPLDDKEAERLYQECRGEEQ